jgi:dolichyl-phosphate-mannose--protein O-mannosyl transferase
MDFMRFVQTRIATIDTYGVIFILLSYFFMYRYMTSDPEKKFSQVFPSLALSGLFFGIGCASKWTVIYAGAGLLALFVLRQVMCGLYYKENDIPRFGGLLVKTLLSAFAFFIFVPAVIYCASYIPNGVIAGMHLQNGMLVNPKFYRLIWDNQVSMFSYHSQLKATHSYSSVWWQWITDGRPILYYRSYPGEGLKSAFAAFGNPIVWWGGFMAMIAMVFRVVRHRDGKALFILIGYLSQLAPWFFITRVVFIYHYFPSVLFLVLALGHILNTVWERARGRYKLAVYGYTGAAVLLFGLFYPVLTGVPASEKYESFLRWIPGAWPF